MISVPALFIIYNRILASLVKGDSPVRGDVLEEDRGVCRLRLSKGDREAVEGFFFRLRFHYKTKGFFKKGIPPVLTKGQNHLPLGKGGL